MRNVLFVALCGLPGIASIGAEWPVERGNLAATGATAANVDEAPELKWQFAGGEAFEATPVIAGGRVYLGDTAGTLYCLELESGRQVWKAETEAGFFSSAAVAGDLVVIGDLDGVVWAFSARDGKQQWKFETAGEIYGGPTPLGERVLVASQDGRLYCLKLADGQSLWTYTTTDQVRCSPAVAEGRTYLGGCDGQLHRIDVETGEATGPPIALDGPTASTPALGGSLAYLPTYGGFVFALDTKTGARVWEYTDSRRAQEYRTSAAVSDELVVVTSQARAVTALERSSGKPRWQATLRRRSDASPVIAGDGVWIAATDGRLVRFDLASGKETWTYEARGALLAAPAVVDGRLVVATDEGAVLCFGR